jgi:pyrroloquinoline quinone biosynthesis protein D
MSDSTPATLPERPRLNRLFRLQWEEAQQAYVLLYPEGMVKLNLSAYTDPSTGDDNGGG